MDLKAILDGVDGPWTEERHSLFLDCIEASFVRRVLRLDNDCDGSGSGRRIAARNGGAGNDRRVPESDTDSTGESRRRYPVVNPPVAGAAFCRNTRKRSVRLCDAPQDQVVPKLERGNDGSGASSSKKGG
ncbi:hypothetical protein HPP92_022032 [Vanilla planifolia]|uniref:Uncharacterized protein n=1 Tax=Vanilla planifolia TaxID=51239 RepID=A0A835PRE4_VANPL|nr:hypothetical protein HPP92_022372 [Vanilla planifolia]KAG0458904.1 hypothetical protein HPP92_022032 [Vanilla planifolia]